MKIKWSTAMSGTLIGTIWLHPPARPHLPDISTCSKTTPLIGTTVRSWIRFGWKVKLCGEGMMTKGRQGSYKYLERERSRWGRLSRWKSDVGGQFGRRWHQWSMRRWQGEETDGEIKSKIYSPFQMAGILMTMALTMICYGAWNVCDNDIFISGTYLLAKLTALTSQSLSFFCTFANYSNILKISNTWWNLFWWRTTTCTTGADVFSSEDTRIGLKLTVQHLVEPECGKLKPKGLYIVVDFEDTFTAGDNFQMNDLIWKIWHQPVVYFMWCQQGRKVGTKCLPTKR